MAIRTSSRSNPSGLSGSTRVSRAGAGVLVAAVVTALVAVVPAQAAPKPKPEVLTSSISTTDIPGPIVGESRAERLPIRVTAQAKSKGFALVKMPPPQMHPRSQQLIPLGFGDGEQPQTVDSARSGYVSLTGSTCKGAQLVGVSAAGFEVSYDCDTGQGFTVEYRPRIDWYGFADPNVAYDDVWTFGLAQRGSATKPWTTLSSTNSITVEPVEIRPPSNFYTAPPQALTDVIVEQNGSVILTTNGYDFDGVKIEGNLFMNPPETPGAPAPPILAWTFDASSQLQISDATKLRSIEQAPLQISDCVGDGPLAGTITGSLRSVSGVATAPTSFEVTGDFFTDEISAFNHGLVGGSQVQFLQRSGGNGLSNSTVYTVINATQHTFQLSTGGEVPVNFTTDVGVSFMVQRNIAPNTFNGVGLPDGTRVVFTSKDGGSGLAIYTYYFVRNSSYRSFQLAATDGGPVISLGTNLKSPGTAYIMQAPADFQTTACGDGNFGFVNVLCPSAGACSLGDNNYYGDAWIGYAGSSMATTQWSGANVDCLRAAGNFFGKGLTPNGKDAEWRCDFPAGRGYTGAQLQTIQSGWMDQYGGVPTCASNLTFIEENYVGGAGADDIYCVRTASF
ncbi:hypothetical protein [Agromyces mariniharenae]|uniref:Uncharacterized protein n=1 Tax=Agromyces mariniharenae TaxID=2604423 RepID=A0A5S4UVH6_9MICO|nr:hypothetical protein [Agromyces mariniharenae]TYL50576.1 hypothetical protein FYC51_15445 [Agromyces mariniharenae]